MVRIISLLLAILHRVRDPERALKLGKIILDLAKWQFESQNELLEEKTRRRGYVTSKEVHRRLDRVDDQITELTGVLVTIATGEW